MKLFEILNTNVDVVWNSDGHMHRGSFKLDSDDVYTIQLDEYEVLDKTLVDFGFTKNGDITAVNSKVSSAKIIGAVLNGALPKITSLNPDVIMIAVMKSSGMVDSRKSLYSTVVTWFKKRSAFNAETDWVENDHGFFKLVSKVKLTDLEIETFVSQVKK